MTGLVPVAPTSVDFSGTSASINALGGVDFSAVTTVSLNGVFSAAYTNYFFLLTGNCSSSDFVRVEYRWRVGGVSTTAGEYNFQQMFHSTVLIGVRTSDSTTGRLGRFMSGSNQGLVWGDLFSPFASRRKHSRSRSTNDSAGAETQNDYTNCSTTTAFDGIEFANNGGTLTGSIFIYGYEE